MDRFTLEICADSVESALIAAENGADRVELCSDLIIGGTSPSLKVFEEIRRHSDIPVRVLIRPRYGDFCYTKYELEVMKQEVLMFGELGVEGIVTGVLSPDGSLNAKAMRYVLGLDEHSNMSFATTLHRAFDMCVDPLRTLEEAIDLGIDTILTSGQKNNCVDGVELLKILQDKSRGRIEILAGSGVSADNIEMLWKNTGITSYHLSAKEIIASKMVYKNTDVNMGIDGLDEYSIYRTSQEEVKRIRKIILKCGENNKN